MEELTAHGIPVDPANICTVDLDATDCSSVIGLFRRPNPPTALFCANFRASLRVRSLLKELGLRVPEDVSLASFGDYDVSPLLDPPMTTVSQPIYEMGRAAIATFQAVCDKEPSARRQVMLPTPLVVRASIAPLSRKTGISGKDSRSRESSKKI